MKPLINSLWGLIPQSQKTKKLCKWLNSMWMKCKSGWTKTKRIPPSIDSNSKPRYLIKCKGFKMRARKLSMSSEESTQSLKKCTSSFKILFRIHFWCKYYRSRKFWTANRYRCSGWKATSRLWVKTSMPWPIICRLVLWPSEQIRCQRTLRNSGTSETRKRIIIRWWSRPWTRAVCCLIVLRKIQIWKWFKSSQRSTPSTSLLWIGIMTKLVSLITRFKSIGTVPAAPE